MEEIKSVRVRVNDNYNFDIKVTIYQDGNRKRLVNGFDGSSNLGLAEYKGNRYSDVSDDDIINDYLSTMSKSGNLNTNYEIIQNPWLEKVPQSRSFGNDRYYLNNGSQLSISWVTQRLSPPQADIDGYSEYFGESLSEFQNAGGKKWSDQDGNELDVPSGVDPSQKYYDDGSLGDGNGDISAQKIKTRIVKTVTIWAPEGKEETSIAVTQNNTLQLSKDIDYSNEKRYTGNIYDTDIIDNVLSIWNKKVPNYNLEICEPSNVFCNVIEYKSPINPEEENIVEETQETVVEPSNNRFTFNVEKEGVFIPISSGTNSNTTDSKIGELTLVEPGGFVFQDDFEQLDELDPEFTETDFDGLDEEEFKLQDEITNNINDQEQDENLQSGSVIGDPVNIKPVGTFDELLRLAGKISKSIGLNSRVKYENLRRGYTKGIHGLCPQGTQAVMYALLGITPKRLYGHADWYSFKKPGTDNGNSSFSKTGYYNEKVKITQKNGKWSGTYLDNKQKDQWQIGDIIVMGYKNGKKYGHIQIWTGVKWMSDFNQNAIQQNNVDPNTVALWRLNDKGIAALRAQSGNIGKQIS